jgi:chemotaxis signal transduction protein
MPEQKDEHESSRRMTLSPIPVGDQDHDFDKRDIVSVLMFEVGGVPYAIGVEHTEGVVDCPKITPLPSPPDGIAGVASVRGRMTVVMDLGSKTREQNSRRRLILVKGDAQLGLVADRVDGVLALERKNVRPVAHGKESLTKQKAEFGWPARSYFKGSGTRIPILDLERLGES